jgi:predicted CopG family antitoxin
MIRCMKEALREVSSNGSKPEDMKTIQVRVSDELHRMVKERAEIEGISMADLVRRELEGRRLTNAQFAAWMRVRVEEDVPASVRAIREGRGEW